MLAKMSNRRLDVPPKSGLTSAGPASAAVRSTATHAPVLLKRPRRGSFERRAAKTAARTPRAPILCTLNRKTRELPDGPTPTQKNDENGGTPRPPKTHPK